ncbi:MAG: nuclear transport factor 2 family protein [Gelidibacter sp.]
MKLTKQDEKDLMHIYNTWWHSYLNGDVKTYDSYLANEYRFIGSTNNEDYLNRKDTTKFFEQTAEQMSGKAELRNLERSIDVIEKDLVLITDLANAYVLSGSEWVFYSRFRFTSLMKKTKDGWRFTYQHFSAPDNKAQEGETLGTEQISKENQELRDAIKRCTIELEQKAKNLRLKQLSKKSGAVLWQCTKAMNSMKLSV